ncbi:MAG: DNA cytosine methyltransferase [Burkholderiaceae bacterium]|nr:DNA cytosine methyltransferase [Burkholderiaceae bacterium]
MSIQEEIRPSPHIPIVDLFAGPGGLGEGFSSVENDPFRIIVSAEMDPAARTTLRLRAFYRLLKRKGNDFLGSYYRYCNGEGKQPFDETNQDVWIESGEEAQQLVLGAEEDNQKLDDRINSHHLGPEVPWVLIGGPPCQAYSLVGRSRNRGKADYRAEDDHRHFLYREYLRIIKKYRPSVFVMENVKGILSASVNGSKIFHTILKDLSDPDSALGEMESGFGYRIYSLSCATSFSKSTAKAEIDVQDFILKAEEYGVPQARHRVILLGVREDIKAIPKPLKRLDETTVRNALFSLPKIRSKLSQQDDSSEQWAHVVRKHFTELHRDAKSDKNLTPVLDVLKNRMREVGYDWSEGALRFWGRDFTPPAVRTKLQTWYADDRLKVWLNHEARSHMSGDLRRYAYASSFAEAMGHSPKGHAEFTLEGLKPNHANWESGKFADRFRVQMYDRPATTVTSHISKDGHYFIHPDPSQCRSLTVREAARLQTFPDNYFFQGNRTEQFHQVGNAVPPLLAKQIGEVVFALMSDAGLCDEEANPQLKDYLCGSGAQRNATGLLLNF